jgi:[ribosomal protein S5]-alanine N-acetyltransferase
MPVYKNKTAEDSLDEGCFITEWWNTSADSDVSIAKLRVEPGIQTRLHRLKGICERYIIIEGEGLAQVGDENAAPVLKGDVIVIPPGVKQRMTNTGKRDLIFLAVCTPRFVPENYQGYVDVPDSVKAERAMPVLVARRLVLRPFDLSDASDLQRLAGDFAIADTTAAIPHPYPDGAAEAWIAAHKDEFINNKMLALAITLKETGELAGCVSILDIDKTSNSGELGYWIAKDLWGQGYCTEAASAIIKYGFEEMNLNRIHAKHLVRNPASGSVMKKLGMTQEGYLWKAFVKWGIYEDNVLYAILRQDWLKQK